MEYIVNIIWDHEANVWIATSEDIPGLVLESGSYDALLERIRYTAPELIMLNNPKQSTYILSFVSNRHERIAL